MSVHTSNVRLGGRARAPLSRVARALPRVVAVLAAMAVVGSVVVDAGPAFADSESVSVTVNSLSRSTSDGTLSWDVSAIATGTTDSGRACPGSTCAFELDALTSDGRSNYLQSTTSIENESTPFSYDFVGSALSLEVTSLRVRVVTYDSEGTPQTYLSSDWTPVTDTYPAESASLNVISLSRSASTGVLSFDVAVEVKAFELLDHSCPDPEQAYANNHCTLELQDEHADGSTDVLATGPAINSQPSPYDYEFTGSQDTTQVVALRLMIPPSNSNASAFVSDWVSVTDPYRPAQRDAIVSAAVNRLPDNAGLTYHVVTQVSDFELPDAQCGQPSYSNYGCQVRLEEEFADGSFGEWDQNGPINDADSPDTLTFDHTINYSGFPQVIAVRIQVIDSGKSPQTSTYSPWFPVSDVGPTEMSGGGNPAENTCACAHADPVNTATGEFWESYTDLDLGGVGPAVDLARTYSSLNTNSGTPFGPGWSSPLSVGLAVGNGSAVVTQENGSTVTFVQMSDGTWVAPPWVMATLTSDGSGGYVFTRRGVTKFSFTNSGHLTSIQDLNGNTVSFGRDGNGNVTDITGSGQRSITLTWSGSHVTEADDSAGRAVKYGYDSGGRLTSVTAADGAVTHFDWDNDDRITAVTRPDGGVTTNTYNGPGQVASQVSPTGTETDFAYDGASTTVTENGVQTVENYDGGVLTSRIVDANGAHPRTTTRIYDSANDPTSVTDPAGNTREYTYDSAGNVLTKTDPLGHVTTYTYNALNEVTSVKDPSGRVSSSTYDASGDQLSTTDGAGNVQRWTYDSDGTAATWVDARGKTTSYSYDAAGRLASVTDPDGRTTQTGYDAAGFVTSSTDAAGKVTTDTRDPVGRLLTATDPEGHTTTDGYDADGNLTSVLDPDGHQSTATYDLADEKTGSTDADGNTTTDTYTPTGQLASTVDARHHTTSYGYDDFGELTSVTDPDGHETDYGYDADGNRISTTLPSGAKSTVAYDANGLALSATNADGDTTRYDRDDDGEVVSSTDPLERVTHYGYDGDGRVTSTTLPDGSAETTAYDADGDVTASVNADGKSTSYRYDDADELTAEVQPGGFETDYTYTVTGLPHVATTPDGHTSTDSYTSTGLLSRVSYDTAGSTDSTFQYDADGDRTIMTDATGTTTDTYDPDGQLTSSTNGAGAEVDYSYDTTGDLASITYPGGRTATYGYNAEDEMTSLASGGQTTSFQWTVDGQLESQADPNGVTETSSYDPAGQTTQMQVSTSSSTLATYSYGWDAASEVTSDSSTDPIGTGVHHSYAYDADSQVASIAGSGVSGGFTATSAGELTATPDATTNVYDSGQELASSTPASGPVTTYGYDGDGDRTSATLAASGSTPAATTGYGYDPAGNLASVTPPGGAPAVSYTSDGDGLRQTRTRGGVTSDFTWDTAGGLPLLLDDGTHTYLYGPGTTAVAQVDDSSGSTEYLHADRLGSTRLITDGSGAAVGAYAYDTYGNPTGHTGTAATAIGYTGAWTDPDTGLVYLRARDYDPATGQFLTVDPDIDTTHQPYAYVGNTPLTESDPTGLRGHFGTAGPHDWAAGAAEFGAVVSGAGQIVDPIYPLVAGLGDEYQAYSSGCGLLPSISLGLGGTALSALEIAAGGSALEDLAQLAGTASAADTAPELAADTAGGGAASVRLGQAGEAAVRGSYDIGPKATRVIDGRTRIFDGLNDTAVSEVKDVGYQAYTQQLKDSLAYAQENGLQFNLYVRGGANPTTLSGPLRTAIGDTPGFNLETIP